MSGEYAIAVHALVYLNHKQTTVSSELLAENICTNPVRIRKVMAKLKKAGLVSTKEGVDGGYHFEKGADDVTLANVYDAVGIPVVSSFWKPGNAEHECLVSSGMGNIMEHIYQEMNEACVRKLETMTIGDIDREIFKKQKGDLYEKI